MRPKTLGVIIGSLLVIAAAVAAFAVAPSNLISFSKPRTNPDAPGPGGDAGTGPRPLVFERPTWQPGDSWTYSANASGDGHSRGTLATGSLTRTVVSMDASVVNVSVEGSFQARWTIAPDNPNAAGSVMLDYVMGFHDATIRGYTWYRASDLATLKEVRTITFQGSFETQSGTYHASYWASVETTYDPALDVWAFPLDANEAWTATSTATVHVSARWSIDTPQQPWSFSKDATFTRDIHLPLVSGAAEDVVTPAGTFQSIPVWVAPHVMVVMPSPAPVVADGLEEDVPVLRDHTAAAWFSGTAKNVVKVTFATGDAHLDLTLTDYHVGS